MIFTIYTDGSCLGNRKIANCPGGYGYVVLDNSWKLVYRGGGELKNTTNNIAEMTAVIEGVNHLIRGANMAFGCAITNECIVRTDSNYIVENYSDYLPEWKSNGWKKSKGGPVANKDLWKSIDRLAPEFKSFEFKWVKAHDGELFNEYADKIATSYAKGLGCPPLI
jgi:ribonuclease HI